MPDLVSPNWDRKKTPPREINEAEEAYRKRLKETPVDNRPQTRNEMARYVGAKLKDSCPEWEYNPQNTALLQSLTWWALGNSYELAKSAYSTGQGASLNTLDANKGVLICGGYGTGKTTIARVFARLMKYKQTTCIKVIQEHPNWRKYEIGEWYFDDLGAEMEPTYAKRSNLKAISALLEQRYYNGSKTIITTNLTPDEIGEQYGERMQDRIYEQFNIYSLLGGSHRRK